MKYCSADVRRGLSLQSPPPSLMAEGGRPCWGGLLQLWQVMPQLTQGLKILLAYTVLIRELTWFQHRGASTAPEDARRFARPLPALRVWQSGSCRLSLAAPVSTSRRPERSCPHIQHLSSGDPQETPRALLESSWRQKPSAFLSSPSFLLWM